MYEFHYDYIKNKCNNKSKLLFRNTDSLINGIKTEDVYEDLRCEKEKFDFSNYSTNWKCFNNSNKLVTGKMKNETSGVVIGEFFGLMPKICSFLLDNSEHKKAKAVNRNVVETISHKDKR